MLDPVPSVQKTMLRRLPHFRATMLAAVVSILGPGCRSGSDASYRRGEQALAAGHVDSALAAFRHAQARDPRRGDVHLALARIHLKREQWLLAANALREASRRDPRLSAEASALLSTALYQSALQQLRMGDRRAAIAAFRELHAMAPDYPNLRRAYVGALSEYGRDQIRAGNYAEGVLALREILRLDPGNSEALRLLRRIRFSAG
jgi:tetratricopeptide (TPR) repeat protein